MAHRRPLSKLNTPDEVKPYRRRKCNGQTNVSSPDRKNIISFSVTFSVPERPVTVIMLLYDISPSPPPRETQIKSCCYRIGVILYVQRKQKFSVVENNLPEISLRFLVVTKNRNASG